MFFNNTKKLNNEIHYLKRRIINIENLLDDMNKRINEEIGNKNTDTNQLPHHEDAADEPVDISESEDCCDGKEDRILFVNEASEISGISKPTLYKLLANGDIIAKKSSSGHWLIKESDLKSYLDITFLS